MRKALVMICVFALGACSGGSPNGGGGSGTGGAGNGGGGGSGDGTGGGGDPIGNHPIDPGCGQVTFPLSVNKSEPNVMMIVDSSGSMQEVNAASNTPKWDELKSAVTTLLTKYPGDVNWGLSVFPHPGGASCDPGSVDIPIGAGNSPKIIDHLAPMTLATIGGSTPTGATLTAVQQSGGLSDKAHNNYVLLMTDGIPTCGQDGKVTPVIDALYQAGVRTYVVGIGDGTKSDPKQLNDWATAGHTAIAGATRYYQTNNVIQLTTAFDSILSGIASCTYQLATPPQDPALLISYIDGIAVSIDATNGVTYDAGSNSLQFNGASCDKLKAGGATKVDVIYGCPSPVIQ
jgi:hypothetical protein